MNVAFLIAGVLALVASSIHGIMGEALVVAKLQPGVLLPTKFGGPRTTKLLIRATWHITTLAFLMIGSALFVCTPGGSGRACVGVGRMAGVTFASFAALTIGLGIAAERSRATALLRRHPAPLIFALVAALAWFGTPS